MSPPWEAFPDLPHNTLCAFHFRPPHCEVLLHSAHRRLQSYWFTCRLSSLANELLAGRGPNAQVSGTLSGVAQGTWTSTCRRYDYGMSKCPMCEH